MDKVSNSSRNITAFGGLNFIFKAINQFDLPAFLDNQIGLRNIRSKFSHSDIVLSLFGNAVCNGSYISDIEMFKLKFQKQYFCNIPSPDTIEYACQALKTQTIIEKTSTDVVHESNYNSKLNNSLIALCVKTKQLLCGNNNYIMDFDNVVIENDKQDAKKSYKNTKGYHPSFAFIGRLPIHIENHNGNTPAKYQQKETLERCFKNLKDNKISIEHFRADAASYQKEVIQLVEQNSTYFYIRNISSDSFSKHCNEIQDWETIEINNEKKEVASTLYSPFGSEKQYRIVVTRAVKKDQQIDVITQSAYNYYGIITNNIAYSKSEIILLYNKRGDAENSNRYLLNDFNLKHLPFMDLDTNTVFMYLMAMCSILFEWTKIILVKNQTKNITLKMRVKAVCFQYITVATTFVNHAREKVIKVFSQSNYKILQT
jgi:hypothetical protein